MKLLSCPITESILEIYGLESEHFSYIDGEGYNLGDLLNMPYVFGAWSRDHHHKTDYLKRRVEFISQLPPNSFLYAYFDRRPFDEFLPNNARLRMAMRRFIVNNLEKIKAAYKIVADPQVLCVHIRSGDKGHISKNYSLKIKDLSKDFQKVIIFAGIHLDQRFLSHQDSKAVLVKDINEILELNNNIYLYLDSPDEHLALMSLASNLLVHRGGFSVLASLLCRGNLYITNDFRMHENWSGMNIPYVKL